jgi:O-antigen/teichoic acid export membrane protein
MLRHYGYAVSGQVAQAAIALAGLAAITRILGPGDYGTFVVLGAILTLLAIAASAGPSAAVLILSAQNADGRPELHGQVVGVSVLLLALVGGLTPFVSDWAAELVSGSLAPILMALSLIRLPALIYAGFVSSLLSGAGRIGLVAAINTVAAALGLLGALGALLADDSLAGAIIGTTVASFATAALMALTAAKAIGVARPRGWAPWRTAGAIAVPMHLGTLAYWVMLRADALAVNSLLGARSAGIYGLALQLSERVGLLTAPLYNATAWRISGPDREEGLRTTLRVARLEFAVGVAAALAALVFGRLGVILIGGDAYEEAALPLAILVLGAATLPVWSAVGLFLVSHHHGAWPTTAVQVVVASLAVAGYWTFGSQFGVVGPALVSTGAYLTLVAVGIWMIRRHHPFAVKELIIGRSDLDALRRAVRKVGARVRGVSQ